MTDARPPGLQPCGHPASMIVSSDEGTSHCAGCEADARPPADEKFQGDFAWLEQRVAALTEQLQQAERERDEATQGGILWADRAERAEEALRKERRLRLGPLADYDAAAEERDG